MKLKNKKTGEIGYPYFQNWRDISCVIVDKDAIQIAEYKSLAELNKEWEDYEELKEYYFIRSESITVGYSPISNTRSCRNRKEIGNYFNTREEADKAVEKLKAYKRLKDKGLHVTTFYVEDGSLVIRVKTHNSSGAENWEDLDLLFGGEE